MFYKSLTGQLVQGTEWAAFRHILRRAEVVIYGETAVQQGSGVFSKTDNDNRPQGSSARSINLRFECLDWVSLCNP